MYKKLLPNIIVAFTMLLTFSDQSANAQNIAINSSGTAAVASAMLDITSTASGLLIPRMTAAQRAAIASPATSLLVYQTDAGTMGIGFYFYNGATWVPLGTFNGDWGLSGNAGTSVATNYLGTSDAVDFAIRANATERMRIISAGNILFGRTTTLYTTDLFEVQGTATFPDAINGYTAQTNSSALYGEATGTGGTGAIGYSSSATGFGVFAQSGTANGTGAFAAGNNIAGTYLTNGSGTASTGQLYGVFAMSAQTGTTQAASVYGYNAAMNRTTWLSLYNGTYYKTVASGAATNSCSVPDIDGNMVCMHAPETPEAYFQDYGEGKLLNGKVHITLDPTFAKNVRINEKHPLRVYVQLEGNCNGVYVTNKTETGFDVIELGDGKSNTSFQWTVVCNMRDSVGPNGLVSKFEDLRFEPSPVMDEMKTAEKPKKINK